MKLTIEEKIITEQALRNLLLEFYFDEKFKRKIRKIIKKIKNADKAN